MTTSRTEKLASIERHKPLLRDYAAMLHDAFELLEPIQPDAEEVSIGKFASDDGSGPALQFSLGYEEDRIIGFIGTTRDNGETYDTYYRRTQGRQQWEDVSTSNPIDNSGPLAVFAGVGLGNSALHDDAARLLHLINQQQQPTDRDVFDTACLVFAPYSSAVRRMKRYDYTDLHIDGTNTSKVEFSIYRTVDNGEELVQARAQTVIMRNEIPCILECLFNDDEYGEPYVELRVHGDGIDERIEPEDLTATIHVLMSMLYRLAKEKREPHLETNRHVV